MDGELIICEGRRWPSITGVSMPELTPAEIDQALLKIVVRNIVVPALASAPITEEAVELVKQELAAYLREVQSASANTVSRHLELTQRWILRLSQQERVARGEGPPPYYSEMMDLLCSCYPKALTAAQVRTSLKQRGLEIGPQAVRSQLDLFCRLDLAEKVESRYRAASFFWASPPEVQEQNLAKLDERFRRFWWVARSCAFGRPGSALYEICGEMDEECLVEFSGEVRRVLRETHQKYVEISKQKSNSGIANPVAYGGIVILGQIPHHLIKGNKHDEQEGEDD